ncbi:MAG: metallophosphoesterase family protein [Pseudomonadota bacterium]
MRLALLSDLHANLRALNACLAHARAAGATRYAVLGDLVGYGAEPAQVVQVVAELAQSGAPVLAGNHDLLAAQGLPPANTPQREDEIGAAWTHDQLTPAQREYLRSLPLTHADGDALLVHATADAPPAWHYADHPVRVSRSMEAAAQLHQLRCVFGGHVHRQRMWFQGRVGDVMPFDPTPGEPVRLAPHRRWLATVGAVGQPRDGDPRAAYALFAPGPVPTLTFFRVEYEHLAAADAVRRAGLPERWARRLETGL